MKKRKYEMMIILNPDLEDQEREEIINLIKNKVEEDGSVENVDKWGKREMAYEIQHKKEAYYYVLNFETTPEIADSLKKTLNLRKKEILRYMVIRK